MAVMEALTCETRKELPWELLYVDDLVLGAGIDWKSFVIKGVHGGKGLKIIINETKVIDDFMEEFWWCWEDREVATCCLLKGC